MTTAPENSGIEVDVIAVGGGASGVTAALQAARLGARVLLIEGTPWLGGMLTSAGVSALDGNDAILSGIHREFVHALWERCGGRDGVRTGWVSNTLFEPKVGQAILREFVDAEPNITLLLETRAAEAILSDNRVVGIRTDRGQIAKAHTVIDCTEFGDVLALAGAAHRIGRESRAQTGEQIAPEKSDNIVQDSTYCITIRDFGPGADQTIPAPPGYDPSLYDGSVLEFTSDPEKFPFTIHPWDAFISYGRLPNGSVMLNWPIRGNDIFVPEMISQPAEGRRETLVKMKCHALGFLHYIQTVCGHPEIGIDPDAFPTADGLPLIPYIRESRRIEAEVMLHLSDVVDRYADPTRPFFKTGIAVGDYFIDHHHNSLIHAGCADNLCRDETFPQIQAVTVPLGCLLPRDIDGLVAGEKSIGVTHAVNGVTRLQPIVMNIGQAAGALAALAARDRVEPRAVNPRSVQQALLDANALLMPFADVGPEHPRSQAIHRVAVSGLLRGFDSPRRCEFCPDHPVEQSEIENAIREAGGAVGAHEFNGKTTRQDLAVFLDSEFDLFHQQALEPVRSAITPTHH